MDAQERCAAMSGLYSRFRANSQPQIDDDELSDDISSSSSGVDTPSPVPAAIPPAIQLAAKNSIPGQNQHRGEQSDGDISSDASTIKPPDDDDQLSPQHLVPNSPARTPASALSTPSTLPPPSLPPQSPQLPVSDAVSPSSPDTLSRTRPSGPAVSAVIVQVPEDDRALDAPVSPNHAVSPSRIPYPHFPPSHFRFNDKKETVGDLYLSDNSRARRIDLPASSGYISSSIASELSGFQRDGVTFLYRIFERQRVGCLRTLWGWERLCRQSAFLVPPLVYGIVY